MQKSVNHKKIKINISRLLSDGHQLNALILSKSVFDDKFPYLDLWKLASNFICIVIVADLKEIKVGPLSDFWYTKVS